MATQELAAGLTPHVAPGLWSVVLNEASGSVGSDAAERVKSIAAGFGLAVDPQVAGPGSISEALKSAVAARPQVLVVLAGDGTLALAAELCGAGGPLLAALPGGTMNMLPFALNGRRGWPDALAAILSTGRPLAVSGGEVGDRSFHVAAILGAPALWADAREAVRHGRLRLAALRARRALLRAFKGRLRFTLEDGAKRKAEALTLMCPLVSRGLDEDVGLEAAVLDPRGALDGFRLGLSTLVGRWRDDPAVQITVCTAGVAWGKGRLPVVLDGEPHRFDSPVSFRFNPAAFRAIVPGDSPALKRDSDAAGAEGSLAAGGAALAATGLAGAARSAA